MLSIAFYIVLVISIADRIGARPMDDDETREDVGNEIIEQMPYKYNIPKVITSGFTIIINGTLTKDSTIETFTAIIADKGSDRDNDCQIVFHIKNKRLEISRGSTPEDQTIMDNVPQIHPSFSLKMIARINQDAKEFFGVAINGMNDSLNCGINNLANIGYIVIKEGVENVKNMLFEFSS